MKTQKTKPRKDIRASDVLALVGSGASVLGLAASVASILGASPALLISGASVAVSFLAGVYAKDIAQNLRKLSGAKRVFLSYSSQYEENARELATALRINGAKVWTARERLKVGQSISEVVEQALDDADSFVVLIGPELPRNILYEIGLAKSKKIKIIPILLEHSELPTDLQGIKYIDLGRGKEQEVKEAVEATT
jgi:predicted nucleotide-binding protein